MRKFRAKRKKHYIIRLLLFLFVIYSFCYITFHVLFRIKFTDNNGLISAMLNDTNRSLANEGFFKAIKNVFNINPPKLLNYTLSSDINVSSDSNPSHLTEYIDDPNLIKVTNPRVYIYNTHQLEGYAETNPEYSITPNVQMASYLLKDRLNSFNIPTIVEMGNISDLLNSNGWSYSYSYKASRYFIEETLKKNKNLDLIIDLHRDSISHDRSTITYNNKKYAKIMFVVGEDYDTYQSNFELANNLNNLLKEKIPEISRGVVLKGGKGVNGIYNQDLSKNMILIECGGNENTIDEVINTIDLFANVIKSYLKG